MATIDDRVVSMSFESTKFQTGVSTTMSALDKLSAALKNVGTTNGLENIEKSANKISLLNPMSAFDRLKAKFGMGVPEADTAFSNVEKASGKVSLNPIGSAIDKVKGRFNFPEADQAFAGVEKASGRVTFTGLTQAIGSVAGKFSIIEGAAAVALGNMATKAAMSGGKIAKSLAIEPITGGFKEYETQLNAVQTILSNTQASGAKLKDVNKALQELNTYSDKTIYNFTEMAKNIGTFTAAGVDLKTATGSIKGIANLAALSGSNSQQASTAMYQLSQAISSGRVSLQDWNSVVNAGMGGTVFQRALAQTAEKMGTLGKGSVELKGKMKNVSIEGKSFRESVMAKPGEESWLTSKVLTSTLKQLSGDMTDAQLKAEGFSEAQIKAIQKQAKMAVNAATQVKTLSGLLDTTKEAVGSGWAQTWQIIFGDFGEAKTLFTGLSGAIGGFVGKSAQARNSVLKDWKELGGRKVLIDGLKTAFRDLAAVVNPIKDAFREIFPPKTGKDLYNMTVQFRDLMRHLRIGPETAENLKRTFKGFFAILDIGKQVVGGIFTAIGHLLGGISDGSGGVLNFTGNIGDLLVKFDQWLKKGDKIHTFFAGLGDILATPINLIGKLAGALGSLFGLGDKSEGITTAVGGWEAALKPANTAANKAKTAWEGFLGALQKVKKLMEPVVDEVGKAFSGVGKAIENAFTNQNFDGVFTVIQTGLVAGIFLAIKKAIGGGLKFDFGGLDSINGVLDTLKGNLQAMQTDIKAHALLQIGAALALLTISAVALSLVKPEKLASAMTAMAVGLGQLVGVMMLLNKVGTKSAVTAAGIVLLAGAMVLLSVAIIALSTLSWEELARGLAGVAGGLAIFVVASNLMSKAAPRMIVAGAGIAALGIGLTILAGAMKIFATMSWEDLGKGLAAVTASLIAIALAMNLMPATLPLTGAGLILVGIGLTAISGAVAIFGRMDLATLAKGVGAMAASLVVIGLAMGLMPPTMPIMAAGLILVGIALTSIAGAIALMGNMDWGTLVKGIAGIAAALLVLAGGLTLMIASLPGAAALLVAAAALAVLAPVLGILGSMKWSTIGKGLATMAAMFLVIGVGGSLAAPGLIALGIGIGVLGVGVLALGAGVKLLAAGISVLASTGSKGFAVFIAAFTAFIALLPKIIIDFLKGIVEILGAIASLAPKIVTALVKIGEQLITAVIQIAPKMATAATALITALITVLAANAGPIIKAGWDLLVKLLKGIADHIGDVASTVGTIISRFVTGIAGQAPKIISAGATLLVNLLKGIANNLGRIISAAADIIAKFVSGIVSGYGKVIKAGADALVKFLSGIANVIGDVADKGANIIIKLVEGLGRNGEKVARKGTDAIIRFMNAVVHESLKLGDAGARAVVNLLNGIADTIEKREPEIISAGFRIGVAIIKGAIMGIANMVGELKDKVEGVFGDAVSWAKKKVGVKSPSTEFASIGMYMMQGLVVGIDSNKQNVIDTTGTLANSVISSFRSIFGIASPSTVTAELGKFVGKGFVEGLLGTSTEIDSAMGELQEKLDTTLTNARASFTKSKESLDKLREHHSATSDVVQRAGRAVKASFALFTEAVDANANLVKSLGAQKVQLQDLSTQYDDVVKKLDAAKAALEAVTKTRDDAVKSYTDQYSTLPAIEMKDKDGNPIDPVEAYKQSLQHQTEATAAYKSTLDQLRALGLDDATYQKLLSEGTVDQEFATQLLAGGKTAVDGLNALDSQLTDVSKALAVNASTNLYQAGVDSAQSIVKGLESQRDGLRAAMEKIATAMITAIKKKLKMKSPSKVFMEVGKFSGQGVAEGLNASSRMVAKSAAGVGEDALTAMQKSMGHISSAMTAEIDSNPTITPILDLTQVKKETKKLVSLTDVKPIRATTSFGQASSISEAQRLLAEKIAAQSDPAVPMLKLEQNNYSPEALSAIEIYRRTNNLLSQARTALGV